MNLSFITYIIGYVITIESVTMLFPALTGFIYQEKEGYVYLGFSIIFLLIGLLVIRKKPNNQVLFAREGFLVVALCWIAMSVIGALPFVVTGEIPKFTNAFFETVSGFTTTGASILSNVEALSHCSLLWRSFTHWIGGMGVFIFLLSIMPLVGGNNIHLMRAESPGPSVSKLVPKMKDTAKILYSIYFGMTVILMVALLIAGMPLFDSIITAVGTAGTGGFGIKGDSIASYSDACKWIVSIGMLLFGVNFNVYFFLLGKDKKEAFKIEEVRWYLFIIFLASVVIAFNINSMYGSLYVSFRESVFQVCSLVTSTGFATTNFDLWPSLSKTLLVVLMLMGACAGSTGGGIKVSRFLIMYKAIKEEFVSLVHPRSVRAMELDGKPLEKGVVKSVLVFIAVYFCLLFTSVIVLSIDGYDFETNITAAIACLSNIGPGLSKVGPIENFDLFSPIPKYMLIFDMLAGRLELFPMLILFAPRLWRKR